MESPATPPTPPPVLPAEEEAVSVGWIPPAEQQRAQQMNDTVPHLVADKLELRWLPNDQAAPHAAAHLTVTRAKRNLKALRPAETKALANAAKGMRTPLKELRLVIKKKFKTDYEAYYPQFGLVKLGEDWRLPTDYEDLELNLREKLLPALITFGFEDDADTGTAVWVPLLAALKQPLDNAKDLDKARSKQVGEATPQDKKTTLFLRCVVLLVRAHYPETWESVLRGWGWRKTSF